MEESQMGKPVIAIANSFTQFVPGHAQLHEAGQKVKKEIESQGCFAAEFNTIAIDDGIAMGHNGMLYSLPSRELIADSVEYMVNAHCADALVCISNCDKITPGMLMAAMRLNIPVVFVSGGPMEAGLVEGKAVDLVDVIVASGNNSADEKELEKLEKNACPTCGSCSGMFTANSMNCLNEAIGLALPGNGTIPSTHSNRLRLFEKAACLIVKLAYNYYGDGDVSVLPKNIATRTAFLNAMTLDIAMGGSTNTVLHLLAIAHEAEVNFTMEDIDRLSKQTPVLCKVSPSSDYHIEDVNRAGGVFGILGSLKEAGLIDGSASRVDHSTLEEALKSYNIMNKEASREAFELYKSAPGRIRTSKMGTGNSMYKELDTDRRKGCIRNVENAYSGDGGLAVLRGNLAKNGCIVKTSGVDPSVLAFRGPARVFDSQEEACKGILSGEVREGEVIVIRYEGPCGGPGMQEMLYPTSYLKSAGLEKKCALLTDGRFSGGSSGLSVGHISPEAAAGGLIALIRNGDQLTIDIPRRQIHAEIAKEDIEKRKMRELSKNKNAYRPANRTRQTSKALKAYALFASSADKGAVRILQGSKEEKSNENPEITLPANL